MIAIMIATMKRIATQERNISQKRMSSTLPVAIIGIRHLQAGIPDHLEIPPARTARTIVIDRYRRNKSSHSQCSSYVPSIEEHAATVVDEGDLSKAQDHEDISVASEESDGKSQAGEYTRQLNNSEQDHEDQLVNAIESHLDSTLLMKPCRVNTPNTCASSSAASSDDTSPSFSSESTKERKGICITVVTRSSRHVSFPSSPAHTYVTFFRANLLKSQVDAVLEEQFMETREVLESSIVTYQHTNCYSSKGQKAKKKKYQGEYNQEGKRHGYGIYTSKNGNEYRGEWQNDKREGLGVVKIGNGDVYEGQFESNLKNGIGVYHFFDGECDLSHYKNDARMGDSVRYSKDRQQAFLLSEDSGSKAISLEEAARVAKEMGTIVAY